MRFTGTISAKLDAKGRVFLPASFRRALNESETRLVLRRDVYQPCLVVYPLAVWEAEVAALRSRLNRWNPQEAMILRQFMAEIEVFELDAAGRFLIPRRYVRMTGLGQQVTFIGLDDRIEIWDKTRTDEPFLTEEDFGNALQQLMNS